MNEDENIVRFQGIIEEIPCISIDYFRNFNVGAYFLSHCHADHMAGLGSADLFNHLRTSDKFIYCSKVSANLLTHWENYEQLGPFLKPLEMGYPYMLDIQHCDEEKSTRFCITLISSGHCPGSVMFLFEGDFGNILYTGDFRLGIGDGLKLPDLREDPRRRDCGPKRFDHIYLDCTFCFGKAQKLPLRSHVLLQLAEIIKSWIEASPDHHVLLSTSARFGSEFLFVELFEKLKMKVHVSADKYEMYKNIRILRQAITTDGKITKIHSCLDKAMFNQVRTLPCFGKSRTSAKIRTIRPTTQWHLWKGHSDVIVKDGDMYRVLYSMHSSLEEIQDFVWSLKPKRVTPISKPNDVTVKQIETLLKCKVTSPAAVNAAFTSVIKQRTVIDSAKGKAVVETTVAVQASVEMRNNDNLEQSAETLENVSVSSPKEVENLKQTEENAILVTEEISTDTEDSSRSSFGVETTEVIENQENNGESPAEEFSLKLQESSGSQSSVECAEIVVSQKQAEDCLDEAGKPSMTDLEEAAITAEGRTGSQSSVEIVEIVTSQQKTPEKVKPSSTDLEFDSPSLLELSRHEVIFSRYKRRLPFDDDEVSVVRTKSPLLTGAAGPSLDENVIILD